MKTKCEVCDTPFPKGRRSKEPFCSACRKKSYKVMNIKERGDRNGFIINDAIKLAMRDESRSR
jgi:hypothetical protein